MREPLEIVEAGSFCWNESCPEYRHVGAGNLRGYGKARCGVQRFQCRRCKKVFSATRGTPFYGVPNPQKMLLALLLIGERVSLQEIQRVTGAKPPCWSGWRWPRRMWS